MPGSISVPNGVDMLERIEADPAELPGGIVAEPMRDKAVRGLMEGDGDDERQYPDREAVERDVHSRSAPVRCDMYRHAKPSIA